MLMLRVLEKLQMKEKKAHWDIVGSYRTVNSWAHSFGWIQRPQGSVDAPIISQRLWKVAEAERKGDTTLCNLSDCGDKHLKKENSINAFRRQVSFFRVDGDGAAGYCWISGNQWGDRSRWVRAGFSWETFGNTQRCAKCSSSALRNWMKNHA